VTDWAGPSLFAAAFAGATLLPLSSEAAFAGALAAGMPAGPALAWATAGNTLGCAFNVALGRWARVRAEPRLRASRGGRRALGAVERWGGWSLGLSWLPIVGDPITVAAGVARVPLGIVAVVVPLLRWARYAAIAWSMGALGGA
jgi:membrane protein YqaA with SNARE-associated domain